MSVLNKIVGAKMQLVLCPYCRQKLFRGRLVGEIQCRRCRKYVLFNDLDKTTNRGIKSP